MSAIATSAIAVAGTLLGSLATYWVQHSTVRQQSALARSEKLRQDGVDAFTAYGGALHDYRKARMDRWHTINGNNQSDPELVRREIYELRTKVFERGFRVRLLTTDARLGELGSRAMAAIEAIEPENTPEEYHAACESSWTAIEAFIDTARDYLADRSR